MLQSAGWCEGTGLGAPLGGSVGIGVGSGEGAPDGSADGSGVGTAAALSDGQSAHVTSQAWAKGQPSSSQNSFAQAPALPCTTKAQKDATSAQGGVGRGVGDADGRRVAATTAEMELGSTATPPSSRPSVTARASAKALDPSASAMVPPKSPALDSATAESRVETVKEMPQATPPGGGDDPVSRRCTRQSLFPLQTPHWSSLAFPPHTPKQSTPQRQSVGAGVAVGAREVVGALVGAGMVPTRKSSMALSATPVWFAMTRRRAIACDSVAGADALIVRPTAIFTWSL